MSEDLPREDNCDRDPDGRGGPGDDGDDSKMTADRALAAYGTLAPGEENHFVMLGIDGRWVNGVIRGYKFEATWGDAEGYPAFVPDPDGNHIPVKVFVSDQLDRHWQRIDDFEGTGYRRTEIEVFDPDDRTLIGRAQVYENLTDND